GAPVRTMLRRPIAAGHEGAARSGPRPRPPVHAGRRTMMPKDWCQTLGIERPKLEAVGNHREANTFALLLIALLERGGPMTLSEVAARFEGAGIAERANALLSLQRCKPGRPPVYREGDLYHLDPHDDELDLWVFRLGLRPPKVARAAPSAPQAV